MVRHNSIVVDATVCYSRYFAKMDHIDESLPLAVFGWVSTVIIRAFLIRFCVYVLSNFEKF